MAKKYRDPDWMAEKYTEEARPFEEIADICDCSPSTVKRWIEKHGIEKRSRSEAQRLARGTNEGRFNDAGWLREQYIEEQRSALDIADECGVHHDTIYDRLEEFDIERRTVEEATNISDKMGFEKRLHPAWKERAAYLVHGRDKYPYWRENWNGSKNSVFVHRLLAVAEYGVDAVEGKEVHHKNGVRWDNRPENIELLTPSEHSKLHNSD